MRAYYDPAYYLPLPDEHPFPMEKFGDAYELVKDFVDVESPPLLKREEIERVHCPSYLDAVNQDDERGNPYGLTKYDRNRLGLPASSRLLERSILEVSGSVAATYAALEDGIAANLAGGTHHAFPNKGLGYCVLNDVAIAIMGIRAQRSDLHSILIVDTDAHQGNANHDFFRNDDSVSTYSIHVGKNYPARKEPGDCDVPLPRFASGEDYLSALEATLPASLAKNEPDLVFWISGADPAANDRFGQMELSDADMRTRDRAVLTLCQRYAVPTVVLFGGGYNREPGRTGWQHAQTILEAAKLAESFRSFTNPKQQGTAVGSQLQKNFGPASRIAR